MSTTMKRFLWGLWFGAGNGFRASLTFALIYIFVDTVLQAVLLGTDDGGVVLGVAVLGVWYSLFISILLGLPLGGVIGFVLSIHRLTQNSALVGMVIGGIIGLLIGINPLGPSAGTPATPFEQGFYSAMVQLVAILVGVYVGFSGGNRLHIALQKKQPYPQIREGDFLGIG